MSYKRIIQINPTNERDLMTHAVFGINIRKPKDPMEENEWVIETDDKNEIKTVEKIVKLFALP